MKPIKFAQNLSVALAAVGLLMPNATIAFANEARAAATTPSAATAPRIIDVSLVDGGVLKGQVMSSAGVAQTNSDVAVLQGKEVVARAKTNQTGEFAVQGLKGGVYIVSTDGAAGVVRTWAPHTAPPSAVKSVLLVPGDETVRAQLGNGSFINQYGGAALIVGALIGTVIFVAVDHNDDAS